MKQIKKGIVIVAILVAILILFPIYCLAASKGKVTTETVRMRKQPTTESSIITLLSQGFEVEIIEKDGDWYKVTYGQYTGYVFAEFIQLEGDKEGKQEENRSEEQEIKEETSETETTPEININKQVKKHTKLYYLPLIHSEVINVIEEKEEVYIIQAVNGWYYVRKDEVTGWIRTENIEDIAVEEIKEEPEEVVENKTINQDTNIEEVNEADENVLDTNEEQQQEENTKRVGYINAENVNFRKGADKTSEVMDTLTLNTEVEIIAEEKGWYKISVNNKTGYVATTLISDKKVTSSSRSVEELREEVALATQTGNIQSEIVEYAKTFLGCKYVYGGTTPSGFDCSGFVQYVYKHFGYSVSRSSRTQANDGKEVSLENLQPGDILIFKAYNDYSRIGHVGLYIGNNQFIHANDEKTGVIITSLSHGKYPERFVCGRRIV